MSRYRASFYHFCISLTVFIFLAYLVIFEWYPDFFYAIDGGWEGMRIIIAVDLVLGPVLTLMVFKVGKPGLKMDLSMIGVFQISCLLAGLYIVYSERPLFFVYYDGHFYSSSADTYRRYGLEPPEVSDFSAHAPARVFVQLPENAIEAADIRRILFQDSIPLWVYSKMYRPLGEHMEKVVSTAIGPQELMQRDRENNLAAWLEDQGGSVEDYAFIPIHSRYRDAFLAVAIATKRITGVVDIPPPMSP